MEHADFLALAAKADGKWYNLTRREKEVAIEHMESCSKKTCEEELESLKNRLGTLASIGEINLAEEFPGC